MTGSRLTPRLIGWIGAIAVVVIALAIALLTTDVGAGLFARLRCASVWVTSDTAAYRACTDVEREETIEQRRKTPED